MSQRTTLITLSVLLAALAPFLVQIAWPFVFSFLIACLLAIVVHPAKEWLRRKTGRGGLSSFLATMLTVTTLTLILALAAIALTGELRAAYDALSRRSVEQGGWPELASEWIDRVVEAIAKRFPVDQAEIHDEIFLRLKTATGYLLSQTGTAVGGFTSILATAFLVTLFLYFLLEHGDETIDRIKALVPLPDRTATALCRTVQDSVIANVNGILSVCFAQGLLLIGGFWAADVHSPVLWGTVGGLASAVPVVGCPLVWIPVVISLLVMGAYAKALLLALWCALVVGSVDNILRPLVVGARDKQHPVLVGLAAIGGTYAFGPLGILLGPILISLAVAILKEIRAAADTTL